MHHSGEFLSFPPPVLGQTCQGLCCHGFGGNMLNYFVMNPGEKEGENSGGVGSSVGA